LREWWGPLRELANKHGVDSVREAEITVLGFPIEMVETGSEIVAIRDYLVTATTKRASS